MINRPCIRNASIFIKNRRVSYTSSRQKLPKCPPEGTYSRRNGRVWLHKSVHFIINSNLFSISLNAHSFQNFSVEMLLKHRNPNTWLKVNDLQHLIQCTRYLQMNKRSLCILPTCRLFFGVISTEKMKEIRVY